MDEPDQHPPDADVEAPKSLAPVLWLSLLAMLFSPVAYHSVPGRVSMTILVGGTAVVALRRSGAGPPVLHSGEAIVAVLAVTSFLSRELGPSENALTTIGTALLCLLLLVTPAVIVRRLARRPKVTVVALAVSNLGNKAPRRRR